MTNLLSNREKSKSNQIFIISSLNQILKGLNLSRLWFDDRKFRHKTFENLR